MFDFFTWRKFNINVSQKTLSFDNKENYIMIFCEISVSLHIMCKVIPQKINFRIVMECLLNGVSIIIISKDQHYYTAYYKNVVHELNLCTITPYIPNTILSLISFHFCVVFHTRLLRSTFFAAILKHFKTFTCLKLWKVEVSDLYIESM